jgi:di/tricarboxylate transporter
MPGASGETTHARRDEARPQHAPQGLRAAAVLVVAGLVALVLASAGFAAHKAGAAGLFVLTVGLWATNAIPPHVTALVLMVGAVVLGIAPPAVAFSGFASTAFWLVFSGAVLGVSMDQTGLTSRIAHAIASRMPRDYWRTLLWVAFVSIALAFVFPSSSSRIIILVPIARALAQRLGFPAQSNGSYGIVLTAILCTAFAGYAILPSNLANMVLAGTTESLYGIVLSYSFYLLMLFPVLGIAGVALVVVAARLLFPDRASRHAAHGLDIGRLAGVERRLAILILAMLVLWLTDTWHHISPAWVGMAGAIILLLPGTGFLRERGVPNEINFAMLFQVAGAVSLAGILDQSRLADDLAPAFLKLAHLSPDRPFLSYISFTLFAAMVNLVAMPAGTPAVLSPIAGQVAAATHLPVAVVQLSQMLGVCALVLPYQMPPMLIGFHLGEIEVRRALPYLALVAGVLLMLLVPLNFLWWRFLGAL